MGIDNHIIYQYLKNINQYKNIREKDIIDKNKFNSKQFEYICLELYRTFMSNYLPDNRIQIRLLDKNDTMNGIAALDNNTYYSLIYWGTITKTYEYSLRLTENKSFFPEICNEKNWKKREQNDVSEIAKQKVSYYQKIYTSGTNDSYRNDLATVISFFAWCSTIFHEAGHILDGHLDYRKHCLNESSLEIIQNDTDADLKLKALEKDADEFSANMIILGAFSPGNVFQENFSHIIKNDGMLIQLIAIGITLKFLLYGITDKTNSRIYLPNAYRIICILSAAYSSLINNFNYSLSRKQYNDIIIHSIKGLINVYNETVKDTTNPLIDDTIFINQLNSGQKEDKELERVWNELYPELNKYKKKNINLAPLFQ